MSDVNTLTGRIDAEFADVQKKIDTFQKQAEQEYAAREKRYREQFQPAVPRLIEVLPILMQFDRHASLTVPLDKIAPVQETNCHPFRLQNWHFVHNGEILEVEKLRRDLLFAVAPEFFTHILGMTDSEVMFHLAIAYGHW